MHDTSSAMEEKMRELIRAKTPLERLEMGCSMYETSRYLIQRSILEGNPSISENDLRKELFLKFYSSDFSPEESERIAKHLQK
ncbi:MAG TPA: hypothetical protein VGP47_08905 [Parachlamydiaceae bacterium]|nr:hypothetical protein [Parachlamydiaceae bacterium]